MHALERVEGLQRHTILTRIRWDKEPENNVVRVHFPRVRDFDVVRHQRLRRSDKVRRRERAPRLFRRHQQRAHRGEIDAINASLRLVLPRRIREAESEGDDSFASVETVRAPRVRPHR